MTDKKVPPVLADMSGTFSFDETMDVNCTRFPTGSETASVRVYDKKLRENPPAFLDLTKEEYLAFTKFVNAVLGW